MARIPDEELQRIKSDVSLVRLAEAKGLVLKKHGKDYLARCPFHDDKTPSFVITPEKNLWHCLGACGTGGSVVDFVMKMEGVSFRHAVELLREGLPSLAANSRSPGEAVKKSTVNHLPTALPTDAEDHKLTKEVVEYYHQCLQNSQDAMKYLEKRGLLNPHLIKRFKLGFVDRTLGYRIPQKNRVDGKAIRGQLQRIGLLKSNGHEHFRGCIVMPVTDTQGDIVEIYGRRTGRVKGDVPVHLYLPGAHAGVWNHAGFVDIEEVILCESLIDAMSFYVAGFHNVTCSYGINGFTDELLQCLIDSNVKRVLIAYDSDDAGNSAAENLSNRLQENSLDSYRIQFARSQDANSVWVESQSPEMFSEAIRTAVWMQSGEQPRTPTSVAEPFSLAAKEKIAPVELPGEPISPRREMEKNGVNPEKSALPAERIPAEPLNEAEMQVEDDEVVLHLGERRYRIRGLGKNMAYDVLKINLLVSAGDKFYVDTLDLYASKPRSSYIQHASIELGLKDDIIKKDIAKVLLKLEALQEEKIKAALAPKQSVIELSAEEENEALALLRDPGLLERILADFDRAGVVGEETNKLIGYLAATSRKCDRPLGVLIQSTSAAGKSSLMEAVLSMIPEEDRIQYSAMTGQSLFYLGDLNVKHKILAIAEEEGVRQAAYALKLLQSEGRLSIASTGKDQQSGRLVTQEYRVEGPVMLFLTTTAIDLDEELTNRCVLLSVNETREQTQAIHQAQRQRRTLDGLINRHSKSAILALHQNAQRMLKPLAVVNPYADQLTFMDYQTRTRRDHEKYLTLIDTVALLYQYQRKVKVANVRGQVIEYIEVMPQDIEVANKLAHQVLGRSLDELPPQTRNLLIKLDEMANQVCSENKIDRPDFLFSRREVRAYTGWGDTQLKIHLARLVDLEYLVVHRTTKYFLYELTYQSEGKDGSSFVVGLIDPTTLHYDADRSEVSGKQSATGRDAVGARSVGGQGSENSIEASNSNGLSNASAVSTGKALLPENSLNESYAH